ncbi:MAG: PIN domain protein, partial [Polaribacter sp.]
MKKQRIYLDTSVFGGYFDKEFEEFTKPLFERIKNGEFRVLLSAVLQRELKPAPEKIVKLITELKSEYTEFLDENDEAVNLATEYI